MSQVQDRAQSTEEARTARFDLNIHVAVGRGVYASSKLITIAPAVICINSSKLPIKIHQCQSDWFLTLQPGKAQPLIWFNPEARQELIARPVSEDTAWNWSGKFTVSEVANHMLRIHSLHDYAHYTILPITIMMQVQAYSSHDGASAE